MQAIWNGEVIAESTDAVVVEGNHYFPIEAVSMKYMKPGGIHTTCPWKGEAGYYSIEAGGETNKDEDWFSSGPMDSALNIKGRVAFWKGVDDKE